MDKENNKIYLKHILEWICPKFGIPLLMIYPN